MAGDNQAPNSIHSTLTRVEWLQSVRETFADFIQPVNACGPADPAQFSVANP